MNANHFYVPAKYDGKWRLINELNDRHLYGIFDHPEPGVPPYEQPLIFNTKAQAQRFLDETMADAQHDGETYRPTETGLSKFFSTQP